MDSSDSDTNMSDNSDFPPEIPDEPIIISNLDPRNIINSRYDGSRFAHFDRYDPAIIWHDHVEDLESDLRYVSSPSSPVSLWEETAPERVIVPRRGIGDDGIRVVRGDPDRVVVPPILNIPVHYDKNLTSVHKYMGDGLRETTGRTILEEKEIHTIPVLFLKLNLIPGQILPIIARSPEVKHIIKYAIANNRVFGVSYKLNEGSPTFGTIAEIYEHSDISTPLSIHIKAMGHQRYEILEVGEFFERIPSPDPPDEDMYTRLAQIKIITDIILTHPYNTLCLHPKNRNTRHTEMCRKKDMWQSQWPDWVYKQFDAHQLAARLTNTILFLNKENKFSDDPTVLSFQATRLGIYNQEQISILLGAKSTNLRLQYELDFWNQNKMQKFTCVNCDILICDIRNVFPMSPDGPQGSYCNVYGKVHDLITVTELDDDLEVLTYGYPSSELCWFPGYKWLTISCPGCAKHLGWRYLADDNHSSLIPRLFYGLVMCAIKHMSILPQPTNNEWGNTTEEDIHI